MRSRIAYAQLFIPVSSLGILEVTMKKVLIGLVLLALPALASAQTYCTNRPGPNGGFDGVNQLSLSYVSCWFPGSTATSFATFSCTTNQTAILHFQFKVPNPIASVVASTGIVDVIQAGGGALVDFYKYEPTGCAGSVAANKGAALGTFPAPAACLAAVPPFDFFCNDFGGGNACALSSYGYASNFPAPGVGRFAISAVRNFGYPFDPGTNYWAWQLTFSSRVRVIPCLGCGTPATILWQSLGLQSDDGSPDVCLTGPDSAKGPDRGSQSGGPLDGPTPVQNTTWGQIKALYR
jgi:hypothetical protein